MWQHLLFSAAQAHRVGHPASSFFLFAPFTAIQAFEELNLKVAKYDALRATNFVTDAVGGAPKRGMRLSDSCWRNPTTPRDETEEL